MRILAILFVIAVAVLAALFLLGVFESGEPTDPAGDPTPDVVDPPENGTSEEEPGLEGVSQVPDEAPPIEIHPIDEPLNVLLLTRYVERMPSFMAQHWSAGPKVTTYAWAPPLPEGVEGTAPQRLEAFATVLPEAPDAAVLRDKSIHVLALHAFDPKTLDPAFWDEVLSRVRDGRLGLLLMPGRTEGAALLEYEPLKLLSPVKASAATPAEGRTPGVFERRLPFEPTTQGLSHLATRLVAWPRWSRANWAGKASGEHPWGTPLAWPVEKLAEDATSLLEVSPRGSKVPILVAFQPERGRVLYFGAFELMDREGYGLPDNVADYGLMLRNWMAWLAGRV